MALPSSLWVKFKDSRDPRLPKMLQLTNTGVGAYDRRWITESGAFGASIATDDSDIPTFFNITIADDGFVYSFSLDANNVGTTDCPFVDWIGELSQCDVKATPGSDTWIVPNVDTTKPVIVECWGAGASGGIGEADNGADGGGGGAYASADLRPALTLFSNAPVDFYVDNGGDGDATGLLGDYTSYCRAISGSGIVGGTVSYGDVGFAGGSGDIGQPDGSGAYGGGGGSSASPVADGLSASGQWFADPIPPGAGYGGMGADIFTFATVGESPGGGGGGGYGDGDQSIGGYGANGLIKFWYALSSSSEPDSSGDIKTITSDYYPSYSINDINTESSANLGADWDLQLPKLLINSIEVFSTDIREISPGIVQYLHIPTIVSPAIITFDSIEGSQIRYSFSKYPTYKSLKYINAFTIRKSQFSHSLVKIRFRAFKEVNGVVSPLKGSKIVIAQFYLI